MIGWIIVVVRAPRGVEALGNPSSRIMIVHFITNPVSPRGWVVGMVWPVLTIILLPLRPLVLRFHVAVFILRLFFLAWFFVRSGGRV